MIYQCFIFTVWGKNSSVRFVYDIHIFNVFTRICHFFFNKMHYFNIRKSINIIFFGKCSYVLSASLLAFTQQVLWYITSIAGASLAADITQRRLKNLYWKVSDQRNHFVSHFPKYIYFQFGILCTVYCCMAQTAIFSTSVIFIFELITLFKTRSTNLAI